MSGENEPIFVCDEVVLYSDKVRKETKSFFGAKTIKQIWLSKIESAQFEKAFPSSLILLALLFFILIILINSSEGLDTILKFLTSAVVVLTYVLIFINATEQKLVIRSMNSSTKPIIVTGPLSEKFLEKLEEQMRLYDHHQNNSVD